MWNDKQLKAINSDSERSLISASAGSGKTTVMVQKVLSLIERGVKISRILMLTFTQASAREMKQRLYFTIIGKKGDLDEFLMEQADDIADSDIGTIDSFCKKIVKLNFDKLGIDPDFKLMDESESKRIFADCVRKVIEKKMGENDGNFYKLYDMISGGKEEQFIKVISYFYNYATCAPGKINWLDNCLDYMRPDKFEDLKNLVLLELKRNAEFLKLRCEVLISDLKLLELKEKADYIFELKSALSDICNAVNLDKALKIKENIEFRTLRKKSDSIDYDRVNEKYKKTVNEIKDFKKRTSYDLNVEKEKLFACFKIANNLVEIIKETDKLFTEHKNEMGEYDIVDLEQFAFELLSNEDVANEIASNYDFVCVDEFQDTNYLQDFIVEKVSKKGKLFLVGDSKQSIYGFRQTEPEIFLSKYRKFKKCEGSRNYILDENYRSNEEILNSINNIFISIMNENFGGIDYANEGRLVCGGEYYGVKGEENFKITVIESPESEEDEESLEVYSVEKDNGFQGVSVRETEGKIVAEKILSMYGKYVEYVKDGEKTGKNLAFNDFAVIYQDRKEGGKIISELINAGIPVDSDIVIGSSGSDIEELFAYLKCIDKPKGDIDLASGMLSFMGGFTDSELAEIKQNFPADSFYDSVKGYQLKNDELAAKVKYFFKTLNKYAIKSKYLSLLDLAEEIIESSDFDIKILSQINGRERLKKIKTVLSLIDEKNCGGNLSSFLLALMDNPEMLREIPSEKGGDAVICKTIHQSKGLEFPVVFLVAADKQFNFELNKNYLADAKIGLAVKYFNESEKFYTSNILFDYLTDKKRNQIAEEKLRLLYVALTRAQYHLYISGSYKKGEFASSHKLPYKATSFMEWLSYAASLNEELYSATEFVDLFEKETPKRLLPAYRKGKEEIIKEIKKVLSFKYPYKDCSKLGIKYTVSEIMKNYNENEEHVSSLYVKSIKSQTGSAYHKVMQNIDLTLRDEEKIKIALEDMVQSRLLSESERREVKIKDIVKCLNNQLIISASSCEVLREIPFIDIERADSLFNINSNDEVLMQGVIDLAVFGNKNIIIDYKLTNRPKEEILRTYAPQLNLYACALEKALDIKISEKFIYVFGRDLVLKIN